MLFTPLGDVMNDMKLFKPHQTLQSKMTLIVISGLILFAALFFGFTSYLNYQNAKLEKIDKGMVLAQQISEDAKLALTLNARENISEKLDVFIRFSDVESISLYDQSGQLFTHKGNLVNNSVNLTENNDSLRHIEINNNIVFFGPIYSQNTKIDNSFLFFLPNKPDNELLGYVQLVFNLRELQYSLLKIGLIELFILILLVAIFAYWLRTNIIKTSKPIQILTTTMADDYQPGKQLENHATYFTELQHIIQKFNDISTELLNRDTALNTYTEKLEQLVMERTQDFQLARDKAINENNIKDNLIATISHDLRTPLQSIMSLSTLLGNNSVIQNQSTILNDLKTINLSSEHLLKLVNDILDYESICQTGSQIKKSDFNLRSLLFDINNMLIPLSLTNNNYLNVEVEKNIEVVYSNELYIRRIISNLVSNALKYTSNGHVSLIARIKQEKKAEYIEFVIKDDGPGIPADIKEKIFQPFVKSTHNTHFLNNSAGLGLSICNALVKQLNGKICFISSAENGTTFSVYLPLHKNHCSAPSNLLIEQPIKRLAQSKRILLAEDDSILQSIIKRILENNNHEVISVDNGNDALDELKETNIDLALLDVNMPGLSGLEVIRQYQKTANASRPSIPIIILTAEPIILDSALLNDNRVKLMLKPVDSTELNSAIDSCLGNREVGVV